MTSPDTSEGRDAAQPVPTSGSAVGRRSPGLNEFESFLARERDRVDLALQRALDGLLPELPDPVRAPVVHGVTTGGKRIRPVLCVAAFRAAGGSGERPVDAGDPPIYDLAVAVELIHAYSLMHDDLPCMDDAPLRRGRPTPHTLYGEPLTMLSGAALIPGAALQAWVASGRLGITEGRRREIVRILADAAGVEGMVGGQVLDLLGEDSRLTRRELDELHGKKTGALLIASLRIGGVAAAADALVESALGRYGRAIGLAFQVADDVLDATATAETLGKNPSDTALRKSTYVSLLGVEAAQDEATQQIDAALEALDGAGIVSPALESLARYVIGRDR